MHVCKICDNDLTENQLWYKLTELQKALEIFSLQIERKLSKECLVQYNSGCKRKLWAIFLPRVHLWKKQIPGSWLKYINLSFKLEDSGFLDTLILVFVIEKCCLCICFTELYFFYWLLVVSLVILFAVPFVFGRLVRASYISRGRRAAKFR